jgi:hypothetical protein
MNHAGSSSIFASEADSAALSASRIIVPRFDGTLQV